MRDRSAHASRNAIIWKNSGSSTLRTSVKISLTIGAPRTVLKAISLMARILLNFKEFSAKKRIHAKLSKRNAETIKISSTIWPSLSLSFLLTRIMKCLTSVFFSKKEVTILTQR
jgi:hypothetical protein